MNILTTDQQVTLTARFEDRYGNPATIDGMPRWETSDDGIVMLTPAADGMSAVAATVGRIGTVQVRATADSAVGEGERLIIGIADIQVVGGEARVVTLTVGAAETKEDIDLDGPPDEGEIPETPPDESAAPEPAPEPGPTPDQPPQEPTT